MGGILMGQWQGAGICGHVFPQVATMWPFLKALGWRVAHTPSLCCLGMLGLDVWHPSLFVFGLAFLWWLCVPNLLAHGLRLGTVGLQRWELPLALGRPVSGLVLIV